MDVTARRSTAHDDGGFSLVEVVMAMLVLTVAILALIPVQAKALAGVVLSEKRQQATGYANGALERVRGRSASLDGFAAVAQGRLPATDDPSDIANTQGCPTSCTFRPSFDPSLPSETLNTTSTADPVLATDTTATSGTTFTTRLYVTTTPIADLLNITAVTTWTSQNGTPSERRVAVRTQVSSPVAP